MRDARPILSFRTPQHLALLLCIAAAAGVSLPHPAKAVTVTEYCFSKAGLLLAAQNPIVTVAAVELNALSESNLASHDARIDLRARVLWSGDDAVPPVLDVTQVHPGRSLGTVGEASILLLATDPDQGVWKVLDGFPARSLSPRGEAEACLAGLD
ncbi:MAG: hypothetical protein ABNH26_01380 [Celeribacter sp.]